MLCPAQLFATDKGYTFMDTISHVSLTINLSIPAPLASSIEAEANTRRLSISEMLSQMLIDADAERQLLESSLSNALINNLTDDALNAEIDAHARERSAFEHANQSGPLHLNGESAVPPFDLDGPSDIIFVE